MKKAEIIDPREQGFGPLRLAQPVFTQDTVARAEQALEAMSGAFEQWLETDIAKLQAARVRCADHEWSDEAIDRLWRAAHDLKGMGGTYGYPIVTQIAASLCRLTETPAGKAGARANPSLACAHVDALRAAVRDRITSDTDAVGQLLVQTLEAQVSRLGVAPR